MQAVDVALVVLFQLNVLPACAAIEVPAHSQALRVAVRYEPLSVAIDTVSKGGAETGRQHATAACSGGGEPGLIKSTETLTAMSGNLSLIAGVPFA